MEMELKLLTPTQKTRNGNRNGFKEMEPKYQ